MANDRKEKKGSKSAKNGASNGVHDCGAKNLSFRPLFPRGGEEVLINFQLLDNFPPPFPLSLSLSSLTETRK